MGYVDLHVHTTASDGTYTPSEAVKKAKDLGLRAIGIADHDTMAGLAEAEAAGDALSVEIVPGVEINTDYDGAEVHVLGYYINKHDPGFGTLLVNLSETRHGRLRRMIERLAELGLRIDPDRVLEIAGEAAPGRPHVALAMVERGLVRDVREAFELYLGIGKPGYVERYKITPHDAVEAILDAGGVPVLAHPGLTGRPELIPELVARGLRGLEAYHPDHDDATTEWLLREARARGLLVTGGSDCHGQKYEHSGALGEIRMPYSVVDALKREASSVRAGRKK